MNSRLKSKGVINLKGINAEYVGAINSRKPKFLSAFWGLDNGINGLDGMPITFSWLIDPKSIDLTDFKVIRSDGTFTVPTGATLLPANETNETQTILLIGDFGDAASGVRPARVQLGGELVGHPPNSTRSKPFSNLISPQVLPLETGPYIVDAWRIDPALLAGDANASTVGSTFIRVVWAGGITDYPTGNEVGDDVTKAYRLTYLYQGKIVALTPLDIGDLNDGDNMHDLSFPEIPLDAKLISITLPSGYVEDPNGDPNREQAFRFKTAFYENYTFTKAKTALADTLVPHMNARQPQADTQTWHWKWSYETPENYSGPKIKARGKLITDTDNDGDGYVNIISIKGKRNGEKITGLYPADASIPGNSPYAGENLIAYEKTKSSPQLTKNGLQFSLEDGSYSNIFYASFLETPGYLEFHSVPPYPEGPVAPNSEISVLFQASLIS